MDNAATQVQDNGSAQADTSTASATTATTEQTTTTASTGWKANLRSDLRDSPLLQKFDDDFEGLNKAIESHANLEKLLGHEKVPIPKGENDVEGWNRFQKAMGIPDKAQGYGLEDMPVPEALKNGGISKEEFAEIMHAHKQTPAQAKALWKVLNDKNVESYNKLVEEHKTKMTETINRLKGEWGDAYNTNVELGQMVINKFSDNKEMNDEITALLSQSPNGIKFLSKIGSQFAENKVGEFTMKRFTLAPEQAREEWESIVRDPKHPYNDPNAPQSKREAAIDYVNSLIASANRNRG